MSAEFISAGLQWDENTELNFEAGREIVRTMDLEKIQTGLENAHGDSPEDDTEARNEALGIVSRLEGELLDGYGYQEWHVRGAILAVAGGLSWGDDPTETFTAFHNIGFFTEIMEAIGFEVRS